MCNFFSCIVTKDKVLWDSKIDSHTELLEKLGIKDNSDKPNFVRVEISPPDYFEKSFKNLSCWKFKTDQDLIPSWYHEKDAEKRTRLALRDFISLHVAFDEERKEIKNGRMFSFGSSNVEARENSKVVARENSKVVAWGNSNVVARGNSNVVARGNSNVVARENSKVVAWGNSNVVARENSKVVAWGNSNVEARENSKVVARGNSKVVARENSKVVARENSNVEARENSKVVGKERSVVIWPMKNEISISPEYEAIKRKK